MPRRRPPPLVLLAAALAATGCGAPSTRFQVRSFQAPDGRESRYAVFVPLAYRPDRPVPVILFLHGRGEAGDDGLRPTQVGPGPAVRARAATFPFLVVFPQAQAWGPGGRGDWSPTQPDGVRALAALAEVQREYQVDTQRVYLTGISVGGNGVWQLAAAAPGRWAAMVPVCGYGPPSLAAGARGIPCWCFHGADDPVVPPAQARELVGALRRAGGAPRYTEYEGVGHDCWDRAYGSDELYDWLLQQRRP